MSDTLMHVALETLQVTLLALVMMVLVDLLNVWTSGKIAAFLKRGIQWRQYCIASLFGTVPGYLSAFTNVSLYIHGMISFGALVGAMAAVSGDEAFVMLAMIPETALMLFGILFVLGIPIGWITNRVIRRLHINVSADCEVQLIHPSREHPAHYFKQHI